MITTTKYHFINKKGEMTTIDSNEISFKTSTIKFQDNFYTVNDTYQEIFADGNSVWHHSCNIK